VLEEPGVGPQSEARFIADSARASARRAYLLLDFGFGQDGT